MSEPLKEDALKDSFEKLYIRQTPALVAFAARFIGSDAAEDVVQEIFYKLWKSRMTVLMNENTGSYLFNAVRHACLDELKHQAVHNEYAEKVRLKLKIEELYYNDDPMFLMDDDERLEAVYKAIEKLPKRCRVRLDRQNIIVRGTSFSVEAYPDETQSVVTLLSGLVTIETLDNKGFKTTEKKLKPGQQAVYNNSTGAMAVSQTDLELATSRVQGVYRFKDEPLGNIVSRLEKYYNVKIGIADTSLRAIPFTGSFSRNQPIEDVLRIINHEKKFRLSRAATEGGYLINKK